MNPMEKKKYGRFTEMERRKRRKDSVTFRIFFFKFVCFACPNVQR